ncbi:MAG: hypothetical protein GX922_06820 [Firmicutes bacterium]|nr:hypothetical protein [Bacillota bacterium]
MVDDKEQKITISCLLKFSFKEEEEIIAQGEGEASLSSEFLSIMTKYGEAIEIELREIRDISCNDYRIILELYDQHTLILYHLGYIYEDFVRELISQRNELMVKDLLMSENLRYPCVAARYSLQNSNGSEAFTEQAELRLYETALVILPLVNKPVRIPYSLISDITENDYAISLTTETGDNYVFSHLGPLFTPFCERLSSVRNELFLKVQRTLRQLLPEANSALIRKAAQLMGDGKAVQRSALTAISPALWTELETKLTSFGIDFEYKYLQSLSDTKEVCIGFKRGLMGDLTGEYIWFLVPIYSCDPHRPGNAFAIEAASTDANGRATYFFRITDHQEYPNLCLKPEFAQLVTDTISQINRSLLAINFRREPIYLPQERLTEPNYKKYRVAVRQIPELQFLRRHFIGRVFHRTNQQWEKDVLQLLNYNVSTTDG